MNEKIGFAVLLIGAVLAVIGSVWLIIRAFKTSFGWGLAVLFLPLVGLLAFLAKHPPKAKTPIAIVLLGLIISFSPLVINQFFGERQADKPLEQGKQIVTRNAKDPKFDEMLTKTETEMIGFHEGFTDEHAVKLDAFTKLKKLDLSDSEITDATLEIVARLPALEELVLSRVKGITDGGVKKLLSVSKIKTIDTRQTNVNVETLREWRKGDDARRSNPK